jgi:hypothetical protein
MFGRRAVVGLLLLCASLFCAFATSSASAAGTTAVTCVKSETKEGDFSDAHCGNQVEPGAGKFAHTAIEVGKTTEISLTNDKTTGDTTGAQQLVFTGTLTGINVEFSCSTVKGTGSLTNEESGKVMKTTGTAVIEATKCTMTKPAKCTVKEPFTWDTQFKTYENGTEMGVEFLPTSESGGLFGSWTPQGSECVFKEKSFTISGSFKGTVGGTTEGKGSTLGFTPASTKELKWGNGSYTLTGSVTPQMSGGGNPIAFTT